MNDQSLLTVISELWEVKKCGCMKVTRGRNEIGPVAKFPFPSQKSITIFLSRRMGGCPKISCCDNGNSPADEKFVKPRETGGNPFAIDLSLELIRDVVSI